MLSLLFDCLLLYKSLPVLLSFFGVSKLTKEIDEDGNDWKGSAGQAPGVAVVHPEQSEIVLSFLGTFYAACNLFKK